MGFRPANKASHVLALFFQISQLAFVQNLLYPLLLLFIGCSQKTATITHVSKETAQKELKGLLINSDKQLNKPYVILVSIDGFRYDYAKRYGAKNLLSFDVQAEKMLPSFPSKTFPNHYTIATGLYPGHNGLVSNEFYDRQLDLTYRIKDRTAVENPDFYNGTPLWVLAAEQQMVSASMFWVGSEAPIKSKSPTYYYKYDGSISHEDRIDQTITWLQLPKANRPHFITLYFSIIDNIGHAYGPNSEEIAQSVRDIDNTIGRLVAKVKQTNLPVSIIVVSDHGMIEVDRENVIYLKELLPDSVKYTASFPAMVYAKDEELINNIYNSLITDTTRYSVYRKNNIPHWYHYDAEQERIGDLIIMPKAPYTFGLRSAPLKKGSSTHGYDPKFTPEMGAVFYATGPAFKKDSNLSPFENIHIYPLIAHILGLDYKKETIDGNFNVLSPILNYPEAEPSEY